MIRKVLDLGSIQMEVRYSRVPERACGKEALRSCCKGADIPAQARRVALPGGCGLVMAAIALALRILCPLGPCRVNEHLRQYGQIGGSGEDPACRPLRHAVGRGSDTWPQRSTSLPVAGAKRPAWPQALKGGVHHPGSKDLLRAVNV